MDIKFRENNIDEVKEALRQAKAVALEKIGEQAENFAKLNLYPGHGFDTGTLKNSITHVQEDENTEAVGTATEYAAYVELGTQKTSPIPYLRPAIEEHMDLYKQLAEESLRGR